MMNTRLPEQLHLDGAEAAVRVEAEIDPGTGSEVDRGGVAVVLRDVVPDVADTGTKPDVTAVGRDLSGGETALERIGAFTLQSPPVVAREEGSEIAHRGDG